MEIAFYVAGAVAVISTVLMLTRLNVVHALLYLIVSLLGVAVVFYVLGAPFVAALEIIIYAGAIMVLFLFVVMMLNLGKQAVGLEKQWLTPGIWIGPALLTSILLLEVVHLVRALPVALGTGVVDPKSVAIALFGPYLIGVELASMLLLASLVGAYHLGLRETKKSKIQVGIHYDADTHEGRAAAGGDLVLAGTDQPARTS